VVVHNRSVAKTRALVKQHGSEGTFVPSESTADFDAHSYGRVDRALAFDTLWSGARTEVFAT
jgi:6-phosphogluconate dehydrogenase